MASNLDQGGMPSTDTTNSSPFIQPHVWVLGGGGFIGEAVVRQLLAMEVRVTGLVRNTPLPEGAKSVSGDIRSFDWRQLEADLPDAIIHLARIPGRRRLSRWWAGHQGRRASERLTGWLRGLPQAPHLVYVSGTLVYGDRGTQPTDESTPLNPIAFQRDYVKAEHPFLDARGGEIPVSVVRPPWVIGRGSWFQQFYAQAARESGSITQFGSGQNLMSLIHVDDCAAQICSVALGRQHQGKIYNLCACPPVTHAEFIRLTAGICGAEISSMPEEQLRRKFGRTVYEALTFSMDVRSREPLIRNFPNQYPRAEEAIRASV